MSTWQCLTSVWQPRSRRSAITTKLPKTRTVSNAADLQEPADGQAVFSGRRVVAKAVEQDGIRQSADVAAGGFRQRDPQILRRVIDAEEIAGDFPRGGQDHDPAGVGVDLELRVPDIAKADGIG